jgi:hypothetical protein
LIFLKLLPIGEYEAPSFVGRSADVEGGNDVDAQIVQFMCGK